jgi:uncharacterized protein DUF3489
LIKPEPAQCILSRGQRLCFRALLSRLSGFTEMPFLVASAQTKTKQSEPATRKSKSAASRAGDAKKAIVLALLRRKEGATTAEIAKSTVWQNHTIRGFISGTLTKKMGMTVESSKNEAGERTYRIAQ